MFYFSISSVYMCTLFSLNADFFKKVGFVRVATLSFKAMCSVQQLLLTYPN